MHFWVWKILFYSQQKRKNMKDSEILDDYQFEERPDDGEQWDEQDSLQIGKFYSVFEAELAASRLRSEGIHCVVANAHSATVMPHIHAVVRLLVRPEDAERAAEILKNELPEEPVTETEKTDTNWGVVFIAIVIGLILAWLFAQAISGRFS